MSRTIKSLPYGCHRHVKGHQRAEKAKLYEEGVPPIRNGAIPPDPWDDISIDPLANMPYRVIDRMLKEGKNEELVARKVSKKFKIPYLRIIEIIKSYYNRSRYRI